MATTRRELLALGGIGLAAAAAGAVVGALTLQSQSGAAELLAARFQDPQGRTRQLLEWRGRVLLCNFWASWCLPCREEIPVLVAAKQQWLPQRVEIVGIGVDSATNIAQFAAKYKINYPVLIGNATALAVLRGLGNRSGLLPYSVLLDRKGTVAQRWLGALTASELRQVLESLLG